jgi:hypothetical protein
MHRDHEELYELNKLYELPLRHCEGFNRRTKQSRSREEIVTLGS